MEGILATAAVNPRIPLAVIVLVTGPVPEASAAIGIGDKESGSSVEFMPPAEMPRTDVGRIITVVVEDVGNGLLSLRQRVLVSRHAVMRVSASQERSPERTAQG